MKRQRALQLMQRQVRARICPHCVWRTEGSASLGSDTPRSCQGECAVFRNLPELIQTAQHMDTMLGSYEPTMRHGICRVCARTSASGQGLAEPPGPLGHYRGEVIAALRSLVRG